MSALVAVMVVFFAWALVAGRLSRWSVTAPLAMVIVGIVLTAGSDPVFVINLETASAESGVEVALALLLFLDATEIQLAAFRRHRMIILRLLGIALPLSLGLAWLVGWGFFPGESFWVLAVLATVVVPVDHAPAAPAMRDERIPASVRDSLNVESGLNDGLVAPLFLFCLAAATAGAVDDSAAAALVVALPAVLIAVLVGAAVGVLGAEVMIRAFRSGWTEPSSLRLGVLAMPLMAYGTAMLLSGNGFIAAFAAGICFGRATRRLPPDALHLTEDVSTMFTLILWFIFGQVINTTLAEDGLWVYVPYAVLALTIVRMVPVGISLIGSGVSLRDAVVLGWLGPRGLASIVFGLLAYIGLATPQNDTVANVMVATVALSVVCHGLTVRLLGAWYGSRPDGPIRQALT